MDFLYIKKKLNSKNGFVNSLTKIMDESTSWLDSNQNASKEEYESRLKEFQAAMKPLQEKMMASMPQDIPKSYSS